MWQIGNLPYKIRPAGETEAGRHGGSEMSVRTLFGTGNGLQALSGTDGHF